MSKEITGLEEKDHLKFVDTRRAPVRIGLIFMIFLALAFAWFGVRWQIGSLLAEYSPTTTEETQAVADLSTSLSPSDPMTVWFSVSSAKNLFTPEEISESLQKYEKVVRLAPNDYRWWIELGRAREQADEIPQAEAAFLRAVELAPNHTYPQWQIGNFYLRQGEIEKSFASLRKAAANNLIYRQQVYSTLWDFTEKNTSQLEALAGNDAGMRADLALFYASKEQADDALRVWNSLTPEEQSRNERVSKLVAQALFEKKYFRSAVGFASSLGIDKEAKAETVQNGGFESAVGRETESYFSWKITPAEKVDVRLDPTQKAEGNRSLRLVFNGYTGATYANVYQIVAVEPNAKYRLTFRYRTENLKSGGNPLMEIINANDDKPIAQTSALAGGTNDWQAATLDFAAPPNAQGVIVRVARAFCGNQCPIVGTIWFDDVQLSRN